MADFFAWNYQGTPFQLFAPPHLIAMAAVVLVNVLIVYFGRRGGETTRRVIRYSLAAVLLIDEAAWHWWYAVNGAWTVQTLLPLHLCSALVFLSALMLINKNYTIYEFAYFMGIGAASQAIITPDAGPYGFPHYRFFQVFISHGSIVAAAIYMTLVEGYRPSLQSLVRVIGGMNIYMAFLGIINWWLGSNYMFLAHKPYTPSLIDVLGPWPWYIISLEAIAIALCLLLYLPFAIKDRQTARSNG